MANFRQHGVEDESRWAMPEYRTHNYNMATSCHPGNIAYRSELRVDYDPATERIA